MGRRIKRFIKLQIVSERMADSKLSNADLDLLEVKATSIVRFSLESYKIMIRIASSIWPESGEVVTGNDEKTSSVPCS